MRDPKVYRRRFFRGLMCAGMGVMMAMSAHAATPNPSLGAFHILDQISPAHRREIVRSVQDSMATPGVASRIPSAAPLLAPGNRLLLHYEPQGHARLPVRQTVFVLDRRGRLRLPNGRRVALAGLTPREAAWRLESEPLFEGLKIVVHILAPAPAQRPFGDSLFAARSPFAVHGGALPARYRLAPGDELTLSWPGNPPGHERLRIGPDGALLVPGAGSWEVAGHRFTEVRAHLRARLQTLFPGRRMSVVLTHLHRIQVYVMGDVRRPGTYTLSPFARVTDALFASGGPTRAGSVREITLKRRSHPDRHFDLYSLLLKGNTEEDRRLHGGEVVFVPPIGPVVAVDGAVRRPALYELKGPTTLGHLIVLAGGLEPDADRMRVAIKRFGPGAKRLLLNANLDTKAGAGLVLADGDRVRISHVLPVLHRAVRLTGDVARPQAYPWSPGMRLTDLIPTRADFRSGADLRYLLILRRHRLAGGPFLAVDWVRARSPAAGPNDPRLEPGDEVYVFSLRGPRQGVIARLKREAEAVSGVTHYVPMVWVQGPVRHPGQYPFTPGMTLRGLLAAAGGLTVNPRALQAQVMRPAGQVLGSPSAVATLWDPGQAKVALVPGETVHLYTGPAPKEVLVTGLVRHPGRYPVLPGATVASVLKAAGGQKDGQGSRVILHDPHLAARQEAERVRLIALLKGFALKPDQAGRQAEAALRLLSGPVSGRVLPRAPAGSVFALPVRNRDRIQVERLVSTLSVAGLVAHPRSFVYQPAISPRDLIVLAGGVVADADPNHLLVRHRNGLVTSVGDQWFHPARLRPGDVVVVPPRLGRLPKALRTQVRQWLFDQ
ncbi:MAG: SLBB domain-containing protein [Acidiferrobacteraceae bacterium]